jgi:hypothetical protein
MSDDKTVLHQPTVAEVIAYLSQFPPETPFRIEDADTSWTIHVIHACRDAAAVWFSGQYHEMN